MKIKRKKILTLFLALGIITPLIFTKNSLAASNTIKIYSDNSVFLDYIKDAAQFRYKNDNYSRPTYCIQRKATSPGSKVLNYAGEHNHSLVNRIIQLGYNTEGQNPTAIDYFKYSNGSIYATRYEKYYVTQQAIFLALGQTSMDSFKWGIGNASASKRHYGENAIGLYEYARNSLKATSKTSNLQKNISLSVSPKTISFVNYGSEYVSTWHTISSSGANSITQYVVEGPKNTTIEKNGNLFRIRVPVSSVGDAIHDVSIRVNATGFTAGTPGGTMPGAVSKYTYGTNASYQPIVVYEGGTYIPPKPGQETSTSALITGTVGYCNTSPLPNNWIQVKKLFLNGRYNIKQGNNNIGTFKLGQKYTLNPVAQYDYSVYWGGDTRSKNEDNGIEKENKYNDTLSKYSAKSTSSKTKESSKEVEGCSLEVGANSRATYACPPRPRPNRPDAGSTSGTIKYKINYIHMDGTIKSTQSGSVNTGALTISGNPSSGSTSKFSSSPINISVPNIADLVEAQIELTLNDSKLNIRVPIEIEFKQDVWVDKVTTSVDNCTINYTGEEIAIKGDIKSNSIKTKNYDTKLTVTFNGGKTQTFSKMVYGVSDVTPGNVFYKFKVPTFVPGTNTKVTSLQFSISLNGSSKSSKNIRITEMNASAYNDVLNNKRSAYDLVNSNLVTYLKVQKSDRTKKVYRSCGGCQINATTGAKTCPTHLEYDWDEPYVAFVVKEINPIKGVTEDIELTSIKIRNKTTKEKLGQSPVDSKGYVDIKKLSTAQQIETYTQIKAGYGFEMIIDSKYKTNLPARMSNVSRTNSANLKNTSWVKYSYFAGSNPLPLINSDRDNKLKPYLTNNQAVIFLNCSIDEMPISTINQMFIKMPDGSIVNVQDKLDLTDGNGNTVPYSTSDKTNYRETITASELTREKTFEFKKVNNFRKYYLSKETSNNKYNIRVVTVPSGIKLDCGSKPMIADKVDFNIVVSGGYQDDVKTHLNE